MVRPFIFPALTVWAHELAPNGRLLFCTGKQGCTNCVSVFAPNGRGVFR